MLQQEDINYYRDLLRIYRENMSLHLKQRAIHGNGYVPPVVIHGIRDSARWIQHIKDVLRAENISVDNLPHDEMLKLEVSYSTSHEEEADTKGCDSVHIIQGKDIFSSGIRELESNPHEQVLIYAPTGVWFEDETKREWFQTISGCLAKGLQKNHRYAKQGVSTTLQNFIGVFGFPSRQISDADNTGQLEYCQKLETIESLLIPFNELETAYIYRLEVDTNAIPGTGVIVIDDSVFLGFATTYRHKVDYGVYIKNCPDFARRIERWFVYYVRDYVLHSPLQNMQQNISLSQGMKALRLLNNCG